jgi:hypothetical protein
MWFKRARPTTSDGATASSTPSSLSSSYIMALEPRIMFDAALAATVVETTHAELDPPHPVDGTDQRSIEAPAASAPAAERREVVFVDSSVTGYQAVVDAIHPGAEVVILNGAENGLVQIAEWTTRHQGYDAIHLVGHGADGRVQLGNLELNAGNVADHATLLAQIGSSLTSNGDILLYGCDVAAGSAGATLVASLADATGADVAASTDATGSANRGGDWVLEHRNGIVESRVAVDGDALAEAGILLVLPSNGVKDVTNAMNTTSFVPGFTLSVDKPLGTDDPTGLYLNEPTDSIDGYFRIDADGTNLGTFDLTDIDFVKFSAQGDFTFTITGFKSGGDVTTSFSTTSAGTTYTNGNYTSFTGITGFRIDIHCDSSAASIDQNTLDSFTIANATAPVSNLAPTVSNLNGDSVSFTEGGSATLLDFSSNATVTDGDSADFNGGNVTVAITANRVSGEDVLSIRNEGTGGGQIGVSGANVTYGGVTIGTLAGGTGTNDLVVTLNGNSSPAAVQALVRNLTYSNTNSTDPSTTARTVRVTVNDGDGGTSTNANVTVSVTGVNDAPTLSATGGTPTFTENGGAVDLFSGVSVSTVESGQTIQQLTMTVTNVADGSNEILNVDGTDIALTNGNSGSTSTNTMNYSVSVSAGTATVTVSKVAGITGAATQTLVDGMTYRNTSDTPNTSNRVVTLTGIQDSGGTTSGGVDTTSLSIAATVTVAAANDVPVVTPSGGTTAFTEGAGVASTPVVIDSGLTLSDADNGTLASATVSITGNFQSGQDVLAFTNNPATMGNVSASYNASTGVLTLTSSGATATVAQWQAALRSVTYTNSSDTPDTSMRTVSFVANDGSNDSSAGTKTVSITEGNDAPSATVPANIAVNEDVATAITGISFTDPDAGGSSVVVTLSVPSGALAAVSGGGVTVGGTASALTLSGSVANINSFIAGTNVTFTTASNTTGNVTLTTSIDDGGNTGSGGNQTDSDTTTLQVTAVNDAPVITAPGSIGVTEDVSSALTGISFADVDAGGASVTVTLSVPSGTLAATSGGGVTVGGTASALTLTGSIANINTFIAGSNLAFTTANNASTNVTLTVAIDDGGNTGAGGSQTDSETVTLAVSGVNDAPSVTVPPSIAVNEDVATAITGISFADPDAGGSSVVVTLSVPSGALAASSGGGVTVGGTASALTLTGSVANINTFIAGSNVTFTTAGNGTSNVTLTTSIDDGGNTGSGGNQTDSDTTTLQVTAVNDAPVITAPGSIGVTEDVSSALTGISFADVDAGGASVTVTLSVPSGALAATSGGGVTVGGTASALTLTGSIANINTFIAGSNLAFTTANNASSNVTLTVAIDDGGNTGAGGSQTDSETVTLTVSGVNDDPVVTVPPSIAVSEDVATALTGISFADPDAGGSSVVVTLSVPSGALAATSGGGVTVGGTASALTLTGSVANINTFIAGSNVTFTTAGNGTSNVTLTTSIDDGGHTGSGGNKTDSDTTTLQVSAVNDAPVITAPPSIGVTEDVASALTGISFADVDAGSGSMTATLSVPSGTLAATSGSGVTVGGSGTGTLTLTGTIADLNAFIAASGVTFTTASNASSNVTLTVAIDDGGNTGADPGLTGTGSSEADSETVTLAVSAVNDAPVNGLPVAQSVQQDGTLVFNAGNSNLISIGDVDAGGSTMRVTLTASNGLLTLSGITGLSFGVGSGTGDATMTFDGTMVDINNALNGMSFTPTGGYNGPASIQIVTSDLGATGSGGTQTDTDTLNITVNPINPLVTNVSASTANGSYKVGDAVTLTVTFDSPVNVDTTGGSPTLLLETGSTDRNATYVSGSGTNTLTFTYTVQAGDVSGDLDYASTAALALNGATIRNVSSLDAILTLPTVGGGQSIAGQKALVIDGVAPTVASVGVPANGTYGVGQDLDFTVNWNEAVTVDTSGGTPRIAVTLDTGGTVYAAYLSGSGTSALVFRATVASGQNDANGIALGSNVDLNGGSIRDAAGNNATATLNSVGATSGVLVDAAAPAVSTVTLPANASYNAGDQLDFTLNLSESVNVDTTGGTPRLALTVGGSTVFADYVSGSGGSHLLFRYTVQTGDADTDGIAVTALQTNGGTIRDAINNDMVLTLNGLGSTAGILVDTTDPTIAGIARVEPTPTGAGTLHYTVSFSEDVSGVDVPDFALVTTGSANAQIGSIAAVDGKTYTVTLTNVTGTGTLRLDLKNTGTGIADAAGNAIGTGLDGEVYTVDRDAAAVAAVTVPANGLYKIGQELSFTIAFSEAVVVDTSGGTPRLALNLDSGTVYADYVSGSGSTTLTFRSIVAAGQLDPNGITLGSTIDTHGGSIRDGNGNDAATALSAVPSLAGVRVDAVAPTGDLQVVGTPAADSDSVVFELTLSEDASGVDAADFALVRTGSVEAGIASVQAVDARHYRVTVNGIQGEGTLAIALAAAGSGIADGAGNALAGNVASAAHTVDTVAEPPAPPPPAPPPPAPPPAGQDLAPPILPTAPPAPIFVPASEPARSPSTPLVVLPTVANFGLQTGTVTDPLFNSTSLTIGSLLSAPLGDAGVGLPMAGESGNLGTPPASLPYLNLDPGRSGEALQALPDLGTQTLRGDGPFSVGLPANTFTANESTGPVTVEVRLSDGRPLPGWMRFDPATGTLSGDPPAGFVSRLDIEIVARDSKGNRATSHIQLDFRATRPAPGRTSLDAQFARFAQTNNESLQRIARTR